MCNVQVYTEIKCAPHVDDVVTVMKHEILQDVRDGRVPATVTTFVELQDYVDANEYGGFCDDEFADRLIEHFGGRDEHEGMPQGMLDYMNTCQGAIDAWLQNGGLHGKA